MQRTPVNPWTWSLGFAFNQAELIQGQRLGVVTTDVDRLLEHYRVVAERLEAAGVRPPSTLLGVARLAAPELLVELEATAMA